MTRDDGGRAERLPRGRHHLSRVDVAGAQRSRLLAAFTEVLTERGYVNTPVAAVLERAGVSRETFYQQFSSKADCFVAALEAAESALATVLTVALDATAGSPVERFDRLLSVYLDALAAEPARARLFLIETYAAGPDAMQRRLELQSRFVDAIAALFDRTSEAERLVAEALVGAVIAVVTARFVVGDVAGLDEVRAPIVVLAAGAFGQSSATIDTGR